MRQHKKALLVVLVVVVVGMLVWVFYPRSNSDGENTSPASELVRQVFRPFGETPTQDKPAAPSTEYSLTDPASLWVIVNKLNSLPANYEPAGLRYPAVPLRSGQSPEMLLRDEAASSIETMFAAANNANHHLMLVSGYRSYGLQQAVYSRNVQNEGQALADRTSARPGHSEHQTGLAADVGLLSGACQLSECFGETAAGQWVAQHAHEFGFILRYPQGGEGVVGYDYEPWHLRYVGNELATKIYQANQTMEGFFGWPPAPTY